MTSKITDTHKGAPPYTIARLALAEPRQGLNQSLRPTKPLDLTSSKPGLVTKDAVKVRLIMELVAMCTGVRLSELDSRTRNHAKAARARQMCMYLAYVCFQWSLSRIGQAFGRDRTTVGYACRLIEDLRDNYEFDQKLTRLETCLEQAAQSAGIKLLSPNLKEMA